MGVEFSAKSASPLCRERFWSHSVSKIFFPLDAKLREPCDFDGFVHFCKAGPISMARFVTGGVRYRRERQHINPVEDEQLLVTFVLRSKANFRQNGISVECGPKGFFIQRGNAPYEFEHCEANELWVLKLDSDSLRHRVRTIDRFASLVFCADRGIGALLLETVRAAPRRLLEMDPSLHERLGSQFVDLLGLALEGDDRVLSSTETTVQRAHLGRIERFIRQNLRSRSLAPELIANECHISVRYLHELFSNGDLSVGRWIRQLRLQECRRQLCDARRRDTIAEIAYRWGFSDHAQFSRHYRGQFGETPRQTREAARMSDASRA